MLTYAKVTDFHTGWFNFQEAEFNWTAKEINTVLNSFSFGYMISPLGGVLITKVGGADLFGIVIALSGVVTIVTPLIVHFGIPLFVCTRFLLGLLIVSRKLIEKNITTSPSLEEILML